MYIVDDYIMYKRDVCKIKDIKKINDDDYYVLSPISDESLTISIPSNSLAIRKVLSKKELESLISNIPNIGVIETDNRLIENDYKRLLNSGNHEDLIRIIKTAFMRNQERLDNNKKIGDRDNHYFEMAEKYLYNEFAIVLNLSFDETKKYVHDKVEKLTIK